MFVKAAPPCYEMLIAANFLSMRSGSVKRPRLALESQALFHSLPVELIFFERAGYNCGHSDDRRSRVWIRLVDLRNTRATRAAESGIDLVTLGAPLGHSKIQMALRDAHPTQEHQARSVERAEQLLAARQMEELSLKQSAAEGVIQ